MQRVQDSTYIFAGDPVHVCHKQWEVAVKVTLVPAVLGKPKLLAKATARLNAHRVMAKKGSGKHKKDPGKKQKASRSPQGKQRQERRDGWTTRRRHQGPRGRSAARLQEDQAQAAGAPPAAG
ncbi:hypothetical protein HaLaN_21004 [Haematococcus lacustris]|uniref:Uncharacterized protein n=1 Tax=Haematococcus lacustris TaxID=44745 RepID=A0A699ZYK2_HAELA|nr:hypothetical protein HaLaN_21004 [Haematococcus lacustris]